MIIIVHRQQNSDNLICMGTHAAFWIIRWYLQWPKFLQVTLCSCSNTWAIQLIKRIGHLDISVVCWLRSLGSHSIFSGVFIAEEFDGV